MGKVNWTKDQKQAIYEKDSNILVAAAAGSGKTAVLVERIIEKVINDNVDIDKLLVVTFTNAAASEMRERVLDAIYKRLDEDTENEKLLRQVTLLNKANICTIDSFCLDVVRNNFYILDNLSPNFRITDTTEIELLKQEIIENIFEKKYEEGNEEFTKLIHTYTSYRDDTPLKDLIIKIYTYIQSNPFPDKWLNEKIEMFNLQDKIDRNFAETPWGIELTKQIEEELTDGIYSLENISNKLSVEPELSKFWLTIRDDIDKLTGLKNNLDNWDKAYEINQILHFTTWPRQASHLPLKDEAKQVRDNVKKKVQKVLNKILICNSKQANEDIFDMYSTLSKLKNLVFEFEQEFSKRKREKNIVDFHDVEHFALQILLKEEDGKVKPTDIAKKYQEKFEEIAIDEYQDSNLVQEYILNSVSNGKNVFMVGDVKQSIYKFRQAMPELFISKYNTYKIKDEKEKDEDLKIQLFKNFRSRKNILDFTNLIFQNIMSNNLGDIDYREEEYLNLGTNYSEPENQNMNTEIHIIDLATEENAELDVQNFESNNENDEMVETEERVEDSELEAKFVANKIKELINSGFKVWDKKIENYRNITYKDIVILLRSTSSLAPMYEQELINLEIPTFADSSQEYLDSIEIQTIMSLLKIIDNPMQDIPLVTVLRSYIGKFTDNDLIQIRLSDKNDNFYTCLEKAIIDVNEELKNKIKRFINNLNTWRKEQEYLSLDELIWKIYSDTGYYNYVGLMPNGLLRQANLKMLFQKAKQYETSNYKGLYSFINFIDKLKTSSGDMGAAKIIGENDDVVRIMSIHKSKGLEFPVVFLSSTNKQFNLTDLNQDVLLHQEVGIGAKYIDYDKQVQYDTLTKSAIKNKIFLETLSEEMRILYVALTRAKEKLFITGINKDYEKNISKLIEQTEMYKKDKNKINPILVKQYKKYLDWILLVYLYEKDNIKDIMELHIHKKQEILEYVKQDKKEEVDVIKKIEENLKNDVETSKSMENIENILNYEYPYLINTVIPTKTSVTALKELSIKSKENQANDQKEDINIVTEFAKPKFLNDSKEEKITSAKKGTLIHMCLQRLNEKEEYDFAKVQNLIEDLKAKKIITQKEAENININKILTFTKSEIWKELKEAKEIQREKPFYINIPAKEIYNENTDENILVQGIIDLYYISKDGKLKLIDYKTDYVEKGEENKLIEKYKSQLGLYEKALEKVFKRKVDEKYIYSVYLEKEVKIG